MKKKLIVGLVGILITLVLCMMLGACSSGDSEESTYTLQYSDGNSATSYSEDAEIIPSQTVISGVATETTDKKFTRSGYQYNDWYIFTLVDEKEHFLCEEKETGENSKWIAHDEIPSDYEKVTIAHGGNIELTESNITIYLTPVWKKVESTHAGGTAPIKYDDDDSWDDYYDDDELEDEELTDEDEDLIDEYEEFPDDSYEESEDYYEEDFIEDDFTEEDFIEDDFIEEDFIEEDFIEEEIFYEEEEFSAE